MESLIGIRGKGYVIIACDSSNARSVLRMKSDNDKVIRLDEGKLMGLAGPAGDCEHFSSYIQKNVRLYQLRTGIQLDTAAVANFTRSELAHFLRKSPYQVNLLLAGVDPESQQASLYFLDYLASMHPVPFAAHGYAAFFLLSLLDRYYNPEMSEADAIELVRKCVQELATRFVINSPTFYVKVVDSQGIRDLPTITASN